MSELGGFFGYMIIILYTLAVLNYVVKFIIKKYRDTLKKNEKFYQVYLKIMKIIVKNHGLFGYLTIAFILLHFIIQFTNIGLSITGVIAASVLLFQIGLGIYGAKVKKKGRTWLYLHRCVAVLLLVTILIHIL